MRRRTQLQSGARCPVCSIVKWSWPLSACQLNCRLPGILILRQLCRIGCLIYNGTYLTLSLTLTITLTLLTLTVTVRVTLTLPTLLTLILDIGLSNPQIIEPSDYRYITTVTLHTCWKRQLQWELHSRCADRDQTVQCSCCGYCMISCRGHVSLHHCSTYRHTHCRHCTSAAHNVINITATQSNHQPITTW